MLPSFFGGSSQVRGCRPKWPLGEGRLRVLFVVVERKPFGVDPQHFILESQSALAAAFKARFFPNTLSFSFPTISIISRIFNFYTIVSQFHEFFSLKLSRTSSNPRWPSSLHPPRLSQHAGVGLAKSNFSLFFLKKQIYADSMQLV